jgi:hypothetical protein
MGPPPFKKSVPRPHSPFSILREWEERGVTTPSVSLFMWSQTNALLAINAHHGVMPYHGSSYIFALNPCELRWHIFQCKTLNHEPIQQMASLATQYNCVLWSLILGVHSFATH